MRLCPPLLSVLGVLCVLIVAPAGASTYWVNASGGNNGNSCGAATNETTPRQSINSGIDCLNSGDTLIVKNGTYNGAIDCWRIPDGPSNGTRTLVKAQNARAVVISVTSGHACDFGGQSNITLDGFVFDGNNNYGTGQLDFNAEGGLTNITVQNGEIRNMKADDFNDGSGSYITTNGIGASWHATNVVMRTMYVHDIGMNCAGGGCCNECFGYGIYLSGTGYTIEYSEFTRTSGWIVHGYTGGANGASNNTIRNSYFHDAGGPVLLCQSNNWIYNNIVVRLGGFGNAKPGGIVAAQSCNGEPSHNNVVINNTVVRNNGQCIDMRYGDSNTISNNICYLNGSDTIEAGTGGSPPPDHNILEGTDPQLVNNNGSQTTDFQLASTSSPAYNQGGSTASLGITTDFIGNDRIQGGTQDIGAWEFGGTAPPPPLPATASWWPFDEGMGTVATDSSGTRNMTVVDSWGAGKVGPFALVCGAGQAPGFSMTSYSWLMWVQGTSTPVVTTNINENVLHNGSPTEGNFGFAWSHSNPTARQAVWHRLGGEYVNVQLTTALQGGLWYHIAGTWDGTAVRAYLNGQLEATSTATGLYAGTGNLAVCYTGEGNTFPGRVDNLKVSPSVLTPADILADYTATRGSAATRARARVVRTE